MPQRLWDREVKVEESVLEGHSALGVAVSHTDQSDIQYRDDTHERCDYVRVTPRTCCALCIAVCIGSASAGTDSLCRGRPADCSTTSAPVLLMKPLSPTAWATLSPTSFHSFQSCSLENCGASAHHSWDVLE